jgi:glycosyltransferase involved in cell wall biosynthesis
MHLLWFNLATDVDDAALGFTTSWIRAVAERVTRIHVVTMRSGRFDLPENVRVFSAGKERGYGVARRVARFYQHLLHVLRSEPVDVCFSHMMPAFTVLSAPLLMPMRVPIVTWYAHPAVTTTLRAAHHLSDRMVTSVPGAYRYRQDKLSVIGQGIDIEHFSPSARGVDEPPMILCAGRISPVKDHKTLLRAAALLREHLGHFQVVILGSAARPSDEAYIESLGVSVRELGLEENVIFRPAVALEEMPDWYRRATLHVNLTAAGFGDKVALEAMACGVPSVVANVDFRETLGRHHEQLFFRPGDATDLSRKLSSVLTLPGKGRVEMGSYLREQILRLHSLTALGRRLVDIFERLRRPEPPSTPPTP